MERGGTKVRLPRHNEQHQELWGKDARPDMNRVFRSCLGYAAGPGWSVMQEAVITAFDGFRGLETVELGCGEGKVSLLFALQGAKTTLVDYSERQLRNARYVADEFRLAPRFRLGSVLELSPEAHGRYDVSMSFGTAEHFFGDDRQAIFDVHARVLRPGGLTFLWVPNRWGFLFHAGVKARRYSDRQTCHVDEVPFSRKELRERASRAGLREIRIVGAEYLRHDFNNFVLDVPRLLRLPSRQKIFEDAETAHRELLSTMEKNGSRPGLLANYLSYPLLLIGKG
jgi:2-polyprenyl-3-methyl-5-hydroxy-6-metoxy-1,4-benzoquinol methylase